MTREHYYPDLSRWVLVSAENGFRTMIRPHSSYIEVSLFDPDGKRQPLNPKHEGMIGVYTVWWDRNAGSGQNLTALDEKVREVEALMHLAATSAKSSELGEQEVRLEVAQWLNKR